MVWKIGDRVLSVEQIKIIVELSKKRYDRPEIAKIVGCHKYTVYNYQKKLDLL